jgi:hypothetical protein
MKFSTAQKSRQPEPELTTMELLFEAVRDLQVTETLTAKIPLEIVELEKIPYGTALSQQVPRRIEASREQIRYYDEEIIRLKQRIIELARKLVAEV